MTGRELAEIILKLIGKWAGQSDFALEELMLKVEQVCQDMIDEW